MGGSVGVVIKKNNTLKKMCRRTGSYNYLFFSEETLKGDIDLAINNYYKIFDDMVEDFNSGEPYKFPMSPVYGGYNQFGPVEYGLVFIDFDSQTIHSIQGYDTPCSFLTYSLSKYNEDNHIYRDFILKDLVNISIVNKNYSLTDFFKTDNYNEILNIIINNIDENNNKYPNLKWAKFTLKNWNIISYEENYEHLVKLFNNLKPYLIESDLSLWIGFAENYIVDFFEDSEEHAESEEDFLMNKLAVFKL